MAIVNVDGKDGQYQEVCGIDFKAGEGIDVWIVEQENPVHLANPIYANNVTDLSCPRVDVANQVVVFDPAKPLPFK